MKQTGKLLRSFLEAYGTDGPTTDDVQNVLANWELFQTMFAADLSEVDRDEFRALMFPPVACTPVAEYATRIMARSKQRGWGLTEAQVEQFATKLVDHAGPNLPTGVSLWLGTDLELNWVEAMLWLKDEVEALGFKFTEYFNADDLTFYAGSKQKGEKQLDAVGLDFSTYFHVKKGMMPYVVRSEHPEARWPGLEVVWTLALSPQVYIAMNGTAEKPFIMAPGLVVGSDYLPIFARDDFGACVGFYEAAYGWGGSAVASFRDLQT